MCDFNVYVVVEIDRNFVVFLFYEQLYYTYLRGDMFTRYFSRIDLLVYQRERNYRIDLTSPY